MRWYNSYWDHQIKLFTFFIGYAIMLSGRTAAKGRKVQNENIHM